jgi:RHS repeat-associated protein
MGGSAKNQTAKIRKILSGYEIVMFVLRKLNYMGARHFASFDARFLSVDPSPGNLENPQSQNRYNYTLNNPLKFVDPSGKMEMSTQRAMLGRTGVKAVRGDEINVGFGETGTQTTNAGSPEDAAGAASEEKVAEHQSDAVLVETQTDEPGSAPPSNSIDALLNSLGLGGRGHLMAAQVSNGAAGMEADAAGQNTATEGEVPPFIGTGSTGSPLLDAIQDFTGLDIDIGIGAEIGVIGVVSANFGALDITELEHTRGLSAVVGIQTTENKVTGEKTTEAHLGPIFMDLGSGDISFEFGIAVVGFVSINQDFEFSLYEWVGDLWD